jgi:hypothetical protein
MTVTLLHPISSEQTSPHLQKASPSLQQSVASILAGPRVELRCGALWGDHALSLPDAFLLRGNEFINVHLCQLAEKTGAFPAPPKSADSESAVQSMRDTLGWLSNLSQLESANSLYGTITALIALYRIKDCNGQQSEYVQLLQRVLSKSELRNLVSLAESFTTLTDPACCHLFSFYLGHASLCPFSAFRYQYIPTDVRRCPGSMLQVLQAVIDQSAVSKSTVTARQVKSIVERLFPCARKRKRGVNIGGINETEEYQQLWNRYLKLCTAYKAVTGEEWTE